MPNVTCSKCKGTGKIGAFGLVCPSCRGKTRVAPCDACRGIGSEGSWGTKRKCARCFGTGTAQTGGNWTSMVVDYLGLTYLKSSTTPCPFTR